MIIIGEKINGTRKKVKEAIAAKDADFIKDLALKQVKAGVDFLDVNAGTAPEKEPDDMVWLVNTVQEVTDAALCLDSANPEALKAGIKAVNKKPMINSLSGEKVRVDGVLPLALEHQTELIVLLCDDDGIPSTVEKRMEIMDRLIAMTREGGLPDNKLHIDPLVGTVSTDIKSGVLAFDAMKKILEKYPDVHITGGLSNISFGMPARSIINQAFAVLAIAAGMDSAIVDPENVELRSIIYAADVVLGRDRFCMNFTKAFRSGIIPGKKA
ncbi:MAG: methyltetrahydrofolate cobalamin methyltransferase [Deltaproteobacteria bacterium]|nr:methyltetrahydrofolate cobalamin methyltransferase [Deltaproteobacteria bacterium]